jgi:hypothetical protein
MTRDFNKQRGDDARPSTRNQSSGRYGEERSPRPARPRLNRATVDRGWETGAQRNHADYRTRSRSTGNAGQPTRDYGRRGQQSDRPSAQNGRDTNGRRPYENRQDNYRSDDRPPYGDRGPRSRPYDSGRRNFDEQRSNERRGYSDRNQEGGPRRDYRENTRYPDSRPSYRDRDQGRGYQPRGADRNNRQERDFDRDNRSPRSYERNNRPDRGGSRPDTRNPRWQSRPQVQRENYSRQPQGYTNNSSQEELFEGDYEHFNSPDAPRHPREHNREDEDNRGQVEERHVTRLPDGRVLKGPRQVQRKNKEFWTDVAQETDSLISEVQPVTENEQVSDSPATSPRKSRKQTPTGTPKAPARKASEVARVRKSRGKESAPKAKSSGPRPSQRGYQWPKP